MKNGRHGAGVVRIGTGCGMADDRVYPAVKLLERGEIDYLVCESLAERTIARETLNRKRNPEKGYTPMLEERIRAFMPLCRRAGRAHGQQHGRCQSGGRGHARYAARPKRPGSRMSASRRSPVTT